MSVNPEDLLSQDQIDNLIQLNEFISQKKGATRQLIKEMRAAILDSGKLEIDQWRVLRKGLHEIEELLPVIDVIIRLKEEASREK